MMRTRTRHAPRIPALAALCALAAAPAAGAQGPGGAEIPGPPKVAGVACAGQPQGRCARGQLMTITGESLQSVNRIEFLGGKTRRDDVRVKVSARAARSGELVVAVPRKARSGPVRLRSSVGEPALIPSLDLVAGAAPTFEAGKGGRIFAGGRETAELSYDVGDRPAGARVEALRIASGEVVRSWAVEADGRGTVSWDGFVDDEPARSGAYALRLNRAAAQAAQSGSATETQFELVEGIFPIRGRYRLSSTTMQSFGGGRGHQGTDHFASCGTPLAAWTRGTVQYVGTHGRAGNYLVVKRPNGESYAYMHLRERPLVDKGDRVFTGQRVGSVGDTGRASGCHLHFELWTAPGWYQGGKPYDSLPLMKRLSALD
jgi:murein DD-endopeptidase MepM/ murein hydrolase activator NlpD